MDIFPGEEQRRGYREWTVDTVGKVGGGTLGDRIDVYTQIVGTYCMARELSSVLSGDLDRWDVE